MARVKLVRAHVIIRGMVQGVFFRAYTREWAKELGVKGWVRNLPDGSVEAVFEGEEGRVKELIERCRKGPPLAVVEDVQVRWEKYKGEFDDFEIRYI